MPARHANRALGDEVGALTVGGSFLRRLGERIENRRPSIGCRGICALGRSAGLRFVSRPELI